MPFPPCGPPDAVPVEPPAIRKPKAVPEQKFVQPTLPKQKPAETEASSRASEQARNPFLVILTAEQARSIYSLRSPATAEGKDAHLVAGKSSLVAEMYGVSPKTIRDVWNRKTWTQVTRSLWSEQEADLYSREHMTPEQRAALGDTELYLKRRGRPPGSKDARPRKRRFQMFEDGTERPQEEAMCIEGLKSLEVSAPAPDYMQQTELVELHGPCDRSVVPADMSSSDDAHGHIPEPSYVDMESRTWHMHDDSETHFHHSAHSHASLAHSNFHHPVPSRPSMQQQPSPAAEELPGPPSEDYPNPPAEPDENLRGDEPPCPGQARGACKEPMTVEEERHDCDHNLFSDDENWFPGAALAYRDRSASGIGQMNTPMSPAHASNHIDEWGGSCDADAAIDGIDDFWFVLYGHHRAPSPAPATAQATFNDDDGEGDPALMWCGGGA